MHSASLILAAIAMLVTSVTVYASRMDDSIVSSAKKSYVFVTYLKGDDIKIQSRDGAVYLTGTVSEESHKALAKDTVSGLPGVTSVNSSIEVLGESPAEMSDAWLTAKVKNSLLFHRNVSAFTEVNTRDGIVTLQGDATSLAQKDLTTEYARDIEGVRDVRNEMTVLKNPKHIGRTAGEKIDDASITAQVKMSLWLHRSTSALNTSVETKYGVVTLNGKAGNAAEKSLVTKLVTDVYGVKNVKNRMIVE
jgi:hyperosmotically inducible periplasmic protein